MISTTLSSSRATVKDSLTVRQVNETVWLNQMQMADLFQKDMHTVNEHLRNIFAVEELTEYSVIRKFQITVVDGKRCEVAYCNFNVISELDNLAHTGFVSHEEALKAEVEFEEYRQQLLNEPSPVERHFDEAVKKVKALEKMERKEPKRPSKNLEDKK